MNPSNLVESADPIFLSKEQMYNLYGEIKVTFVRYYKYCFLYSAKLPNGYTLQAEYGGCDEIYKHEVRANEEICLNELDPCSVTVYDTNSAIVAQYIVRICNN